jgi:uncharacterized membrane protein
MDNQDSELMFKPGTFAALGYGWRSLKPNFLVFFLAALVIMVFQSPISDRQVQEASGILSLLLVAYGLLFYPLVNYGADKIFLMGARGDDVKIKHIVDGVYRYIDVILAALLTFGLIGISLVVFIIPGVYVACRLVFTSYLVMDEGLDPVEAVEASWRMTKGHVLKVFFLGLLALPIIVGGLVLLIVGVFPAFMWLKASFAALYLSISEHGS